MHIAKTFLVAKKLVQEILTKNTVVLLTKFTQEANKVITPISNTKDGDIVNVLMNQL